MTGHTLYGTEPYADRNEEIYRRYCKGETQPALGRAFGLSQPQISLIIKNIREAAGPVDLEARRAAMLAQLDEGRRLAWELAAMEGAPVTAGKDGRVVVDPETKQPVRDYGGRVNALKLMTTLMERETRLLGLDAPVRADLTVHGEMDAANALAEEAAAELNGEG